MMPHKLLLVFLLVALAACSTGTSLPAPTETNVPEHRVAPTSTRTELPPAQTSTPQPAPQPARLGPNEFPAGYNPLSGQPVADPSLLGSPALLVSISNFPPAARPQAGMSFSPFVYEYFITEGSTRYLAAFYGESPEPEIPLHGDCEVRDEPVPDTGTLLGNFVWYDRDRNGVQDAGEGGIGGICIDLLDADGKPLQHTTTDSNGYYAFHAEAGEYTLAFEKPSWLEFARKNVGDEGTDSDVDPATGQTDPIRVGASSLLFWDAGLVPSPNAPATPTPSTKLPAAEVGPVRSGRMVYRHIGNSYQDSCLIYASADRYVLAHIPGCATVPHTVTGGGAMLSLDRMKRIRDQVTKKASQKPLPFDYTGNLFTDELPPSGKPVTELHEFWSRLNQSKWVYDAASGAWWRYVDESREETAGKLHPDTDRLTGRQLKFENIVLLYAEHVVITPTIVDIDLDVGRSGKAFLFRDGKVNEIRWSTVADPYEQKTGLRRPLRFLNPDGTAAALKPGHTWVIIFDLESYLEERSPGMWRARFVAPAGAKDY